MLNMHIGYNPPSSWRILFWSGGRPRKFSHLKHFRSLIDPGRVCCKGIFIQGIQLPSGLPVIGQSFLRIKGYVTGESVHAPRQRNSPYGQTDRLSIYNTVQPKHPQWSIFWYELFPQGPPFLGPVTITTTFININLNSFNFDQLAFVFLIFRTMCP